jgi:hypothetical protein
MTTQESSQDASANRKAAPNEGAPPEETRRAWLAALRARLHAVSEREAEASEESSGETSGETPADSAGNRRDDAKARTVRNQTPHRLVVTIAGGERIVFAPLEARVFTEEHLPSDGLDDLGVLKPTSTKPIGHDTAEVLTQIAVAVFWTAIIGWVVISNVVDANPGLSPWIWIVAGVVMVLVMVTAYIVMTEQEPFVGRLVAQTMTLVFVLIVSVGIPTATVWRFADEDFWSMSGLDVFVRLSQIAIISVASMLPGLLFFFFDRQKLSTLRNRFERQIFRLDPNVESLADVDARYGRQLDETFGGSKSGEGLRLARQRRLPILIGTIVLSISWTIALAPVSSLPDDLTPAGIGEVLAPHPDPVSFGFLGAYFYSLNLVWRRYTRSDLRPKAYSAITVRILTVLVVTWVIAAVAPDTSGYVLVLSFLIGIVPETVFVLLREWFARSRGGAAAFALKALEERQPLQDLDGMDLYDRARLLDEGISNVQALSHHDLVDLLLETRVPAGRLVDWMDQSVLYLHCARHSCDREPANANGTQPPNLLARLHLVGIRTATDFEVAMKESKYNLLAHSSNGAATFEAPVLELLLTSLRDDEWLQYIKHWRVDEPVRNIGVSLDAAGRIVTGPEFVADDPSLPEGDRSSDVQDPGPSACQSP